MQTRFSRLERALVGVVVLLSGIFLTFLLQQSVFLTTQDTFTIDMGSQKGFYTADTPLVHLAVFVLLGYLAFRLARLDTARRAKIWRWLRWPALAAAAVTVWLLVWLLVGYCVQPKEDPELLLTCAQQLLDGDFSPLQDGAYLQVFSNQHFMVLYVMLFLRLFGANAVLALQLANVFWFLLAAVFTARAMGLLCAAPHRRPLYLLVLLLWPPMALFAPYVYGTVPGLAMCSLQIFAMAHCLQPGKRAYACPAWYLLCAAAGALSVLFKQNYFIVSIAVCLYLGWQSLRALTGRQGTAAWALPLLSAAVFLLLYGVADSAVHNALYAGTGLEQRPGQPTSFFVSIGLSETDASEGWIYLGEGSIYDLDLHQTMTAAELDELFRQTIRERMDDFARDPAGAVRFFARKTTSEWNMPTFQSLYGLRNHVTVPNGVRWAKALFAVGGRLEPFFSKTVDLMESQLWAWALVGLLLARRRLRPEDVFFCVVFVGGMLFHLAWEAKARYTVTYAFLLLPLAVQGWCTFGRWAAALRTGVHPKALCKAQWPLLLCAAFLTVSGVSGQYISCTRAEAARDLAVYAAWRAEQAPALPEGTHMLYQAVSDAPLTMSTTKSGAHLRAVEGGDAALFTLLPLHDSLLLDSVPQTQACQILLAPDNAVAIGLGSDGNALFVSQKDHPDPLAWTQQWLLLPTDGGALWALCILDTNENYLALTDDGTGTLSLQPYDAQPAQFWRIVPCAQ